jgi:hypothetical protein
VSTAQIRRFLTCRYGKIRETPHRADPAHRRLQISVHVMVSLEKQVAFSDGRQQIVDLSQHSQVNDLLRELSRSGCVVIKDAVTSSPSPDDPAIRQNEVRENH